MTPFSRKQREDKISGSQSMCATLIQTLVRKIEQIRETANFVKSGWSDLNLNFGILQFKIGCKIVKAIAV